jgi:hypothetical protein
MSPRLAGAIWYVGRFLQAFAMWILLMDIFMAGPMGPARSGKLRSVSQRRYGSVHPSRPG